MIKHIVMWKILKDGTAEERLAACREFAEKTAYLQSIIPEIKEAKVGWNVNDGDVFHICIDSVFENLDDLNTYINNPEHMKVRTWLNSILYDKAVMDYEF